MTRGLQASLSECEAAGAGIADAWARALRTGRRQALRTCEHRAGLSPLSESLAAQSESARTRVAARESQVLSPLSEWLGAHETARTRIAATKSAVFLTTARIALDAPPQPYGVRDRPRAANRAGRTHGLRCLRSARRTPRLDRGRRVEVVDENKTLVDRVGVGGATGNVPAVAAFTLWLLRASGEWACRLHRSRPTWSGDGDCS